MHIGLIGGIGPAATEYYYRHLVAARAKAKAPLELTIAHADMARLLSNLAAGHTVDQARVFQKHVAQLAGAGAQIAAVTSIAGHFCIDALEEISTLPVANALTIVSKELVHRGFARVGLLGSKAAMASRLYGTLAELDIVLPRDDELDRVGDEYLAMATAQHASEAQRELFFNVGARLCSEQGAEVVVLAGTDMFLAFEGHEPGFPTLDCADIHIGELANMA
jgi:aspartate racemase